MPSLGSELAEIVVGLTLTHVNAQVRHNTHVATGEGEGGRFCRWQVAVVRVMLAGLPCVCKGVSVCVCAAV